MNAWPVLTTRAERSRFNPRMGSYSGFEPSMIGFDGIVCVLLHDMARGGQQLIEYSLVGRCPICGHLARAYAVLEGAGEEPAGGCQIPFLGYQHVDDLVACQNSPQV
jgi:hypothetical protein